MPFQRPPTTAAPADPADADPFVTAARRITSSRHPDDIWRAVANAIEFIAGDVVSIVHRPMTTPVGPGVDIRVQGTTIARLEWQEPLRSEQHDSLALIATVAGASLAVAQPDIGQPNATYSTDTVAPERRRLDRDVIDHLRAGHLGMIVIHSRDAAWVAGQLTSLVRAADTVYHSSPTETIVLLPLTSRVETGLAAHRLWESFRQLDRAPRARWGVSFGRFDEPQWLETQALQAVEQAERLDVGLFCYLG